MYPGDPRSHPTRDVWVEIKSSALSSSGWYVTSHTGCVSRNWYRSLICYDRIASHPTRDVWVEICLFHIRQCYLLSHPTRDVWVEMRVIWWLTTVNSVTSHTGCVSRNCSVALQNLWSWVTSHTGCVSRNWEGCSQRLMHMVTSHTGCVSRNLNTTIAP